MKQIILIIIAFQISLSVLAQDALKEGEAFYNEGNYKMALENYLKAYKSDSTNVDLRYNMAVCYLELNIDKAPALMHLEWITKQSKFPDYAWFDLARAYHSLHQFDKAIANYKKYESVGKDKVFIEEAKLGKKQCENAKTLISKPIDVTFENIGSDVNTEHNEYQPYIPADESTLIYTSDQKYDSRYQVQVNNVYIAEKNKENWIRPMTVGTVNSSEDEFMSGLAANDEFIFVKYQRYEAFDDIFMADKKNKRIGKPIALDEINTSSIENGATLSRSNDTLIFSSDRAGGLGGMDLWMSIKLPDGKWGTPVNLGEPINTPYDDDYPHLMPDGKNLFFSSTGHNSMGGYDVFKTKLNVKTGKWSAPMNFGYPINNTLDNLTIAMSNNYRYAYVSDVRPEGKGGMDIYRVIFNNTEANIFLHECQLFVGKGESASAYTADAEPEIKVLEKESKDLFGKYKFNKDKNQFIMALPPGNYTLRISVDGYKPHEEDIFVPDLLQQQIYKLKISLEAL